MYVMPDEYVGMNKNRDDPIRSMMLVVMYLHDDDGKTHRSIQMNRMLISIDNDERVNAYDLQQSDENEDDKNLSNLVEMKDAKEWACQ